MLLLLLLFSYTLFTQETDQNPNSLTYEQYVKERQKQQQLLLDLNTPRATLDDYEIDSLLDQLQGMTAETKKSAHQTLPNPRALLYCSEFIQKRSLSPLCAIYQHELFTVYRYHLSDALTFSLHLETDLHGNSMTEESEAKIYRETRHPELQKSYAQIAEDAIAAIKKELPNMSNEEKRNLLKKGLYNIENYQEQYRKLFNAQRKSKQGVARSAYEIEKLKKILHNLENKPDTRPNPLLILLLKKPELLQEEEPFFI